jgi:ATP synthase protein I
MNSESKRKAPSIVKPDILRWQFIELAALILIAALGVVVDAEVVRSIAGGGLIALIPQMYFTYQAFRYRGARGMRLITHAFYRGEAGKFFLTGGLFALVFVLVKPAQPLALLLSFVVWQLLNWIGGALIMRR